MVRRMLVLCGTAGLAAAVVTGPAILVAAVAAELWHTRQRPA